ncbi:hypothetical protein DFH08DRAFT_937733 [Mycena albidolilacea]|uniref:Uncharacterized protein n=1 Tax=Mycena albidolilacea TaxID=1033008 RepID=A0AAD6ZYB7_9AGAR|nr:hypothetical protein DFH08DRAFT_937733 [Mycena albidolilacea]
MEVKSTRMRKFADVTNSRLDSGMFRLKSTKVPEMGTVRIFVIVGQPMIFKNHSARFSGFHAVVRKQVQQLKEAQDNRPQGDGGMIVHDTCLQIGGNLKFSGTNAFLRAERTSWAGGAAVLMALMGSVGRDRLATSLPDFDDSDGGMMGRRCQMCQITFGPELHHRKLEANSVQ